MKIGLVCPYNVAKGGGVQEYVRELQAGLMAKGHDVVTVTPQPREHFEHNDRRIAFLGTAGDFKTPLNTVSQLSASVMTDDIDALLDYEQFDILHFHEPWVPMLSRQILSRSRAINIATFHAKLPETLMSRTMARVVTPYTKPLLKYIDEFTAVSEAAAEYVHSLTDAPIKIIPNGINLSAFQITEHKVHEGTKSILYIGRLERRKGVRYLLQAMQLLEAHEHDVELLIAGNGPDRQKLIEYAKELGLKRVHFLGFVEDEKKRELFRDSDLFCSPALYGESFGIVLLEAMAVGLVTVAGDNPGYSSVMQGVGKLSLVDPKNTLEFARRLQLLLYTEELREVWQKWAKSHVKQFDYPKIVDAYEKVYKEAIAKKRKKHAA